MKNAPFASSYSSNEFSEACWFTLCVSWSGDYIATETAAAHRQRIDPILEVARSFQLGMRLARRRRPFSAPKSGVIPVQRQTESETVCRQIESKSSSICSSLSASLLVCNRWPRLTSGMTWSLLIRGVHCPARQCQTATGEGANSQWHASRRF